MVTPLYSEWHRFMNSSLSTNMIKILNDNRKRWEAQEISEQAEETRTELSDADPEPEDEELNKLISDTFVTDDLTIDSNRLV